MVYREFGKTGLKVSALGFGCMRLPRNPEGKIDEDLSIQIISKAYDAGINYFDNAWGYAGGRSELILGKALEDVREKVFYSSKVPVWSLKEPEDFWKCLTESLERLRTDYIDFYHFHAVDSVNWKTTLDMKLLEKAEKAKSMGICKHLSFSFHDDPALMKEIIDTGIFSSVLCQYNLIDRTNEEMMQYAKEKGLGVAVMGPLGGGNIIKGGVDFTKKFNTRAETAAELAFRFVWGNPAVSIAFSGMNSAEQLEDNLKYAESANDISSNEWEYLKKGSEELIKLSDLYCTACGYCEVCPHGIKPAFTFEAYNLLNVWNLADIAKIRYGEFDEYPWHGNHPDNCTKCGACSARCPQKISIPDELERVVGILKAL